MLKKYFLGLFLGENTLKKTEKTKLNQHGML
jgi:hypothetical protein